MPTKVVQTISVTNTVQATFTTALNSALSAIPSNDLLDISFTTVGTAAAPRYSALIMYFKYN